MPAISSWGGGDFRGQLGSATRSNGDPTMELEDPEEALAKVIAAEQGVFIHPQVKFPFSLCVCARAHGKKSCHRVRESWGLLAFFFAIIRLMLFR